MEKQKKQNPGAEAAGEAQHRKILRDMLTFGMSGKEADKVCDSLLNALGSFDGIFTAPEEVLRDLPGVGEDTARFLRQVIEFSKAYLEERSWNLLRVYDTPSAVEVFRPKFLGRNTEAVALMLLDNRGRVVYSDIICEGSFSEAPLHMRHILQLCIQYQVEEVYLAHNHPSGAAFPSPSDLVATDRLLVGLNSISAYLCDHIIFAGDSFFSFSSSGILRLQEDVVRRSQVSQVKAAQRLMAVFRGESGDEPDGST